MHMVCALLSSGFDWSWWHHQMEPFSALLAICVGNSPVTGEFPSQRPVTRSFNFFFDLRLNIQFSKQSWGWWFETPSRPFSRHCNGFLPNFPGFFHLGWGNHMTAKNINRCMNLSGNQIKAQQDNAHELVHILLEIIQNRIICPMTVSWHLYFNTLFKQFRWNIQHPTEHYMKYADQWSQ